MSDLEQKIRACAEAVAAASRDEVEDATWAVSDELEADGKPIEKILDGIRFAKRMQTCTSAGGTIFHISWCNGASVTYESEGEETLEDLMKSLIRNGETENDRAKQ